MKAADQMTAAQRWAFGITLAICLVLPALHVRETGAGGVAADAGLDAAIGKGLFKRNWVPAPSSTKSNDGLGPLFNARSCQQCHAAGTAGRIETDGKGRLTERGAVVRLAGAKGEPDLVYGAQIQTRAIQMHKAEANVALSWREHEAVLQDGSRVPLRRPVPHIDVEPAAPRPGANSAVSLVLAPSLAAAAQIARVDVQALAQLPLGAGRLSKSEQGDVLVFGRKATEASLAHAIETAFMRDLGMSAGRHAQPAGDCTAQQTACLAGPHGDDGSGIEIAPEIVSALSSYVMSLAPSSHSAGDVAGQRLFAATGCALCHQPALPGKDGSAVMLHSDLRLHDMGGDLAGFAEAQGQTASQWRTAPLLGLKKRLAAGSTLLHDGRARTVEEAILWHGGEGQSARDAYARLTAAERKALQDYVLSR